ncbi:hypothetical protein C1O63_0044 [Dehalococcoides mccartyi]|nr:hypothetical protein C1O63_0044 [Dehalococcoides mccartyi]
MLAKTNPHLQPIHFSTKVKVFSHIFIIILQYLLPNVSE